METIMSDLLKEAIADAKAVRETALQNAKMALEEAFTPHLKSMLSAKLAEDDIEEGGDKPRIPREDDDEEEDAEEMARYEGEHEDDDPRREDDDDNPVDINIDADGDDDEEMDESEIIEIDGVKYAPVVSEEEHEEDDDEEMGEELDLEAVIKELETEIAESDGDLTEGEHEDDEDEKKDESVEESVDEDVVTEEDEEDEDKDKTDEQSTSSGIGKGTGVKQPSASDEEDPGKGKVHEQVNAMQNELNEYKEAITYLREKLHEVNILNAKLLYTNRLFKEYVLSNGQKMKVVETFDRAQTTREIKLVYSTLAESFNDRETIKKKSIKESASQKTGTTAPKKKIISEEDNVANRFKKLAGILKD